MTTCHCPTCDEPDPHCEHGVNLAIAICSACEKSLLHDAICEDITDDARRLDALHDEINDDIANDSTQGRWK